MNISTEFKGPIAYSTDELNRVSAGNSAAVLPVHAYVHTPSQNSKGIASAGPLGLFAFAGSIFTLSLYNLGARGITVPNAIIGMACFAGGLGQFVAGMWEFAAGNLFGASAFSTYGGFWWAYAALLHPSFGVSDAYAKYPGQLNSAIGIFLATWFIITFIFLLATLRTNLVTIVLFFLLDMTFLVLMISVLADSITIHKIGGWIGLADGVVAFYAAAAQLLTEESSWFTLPVGTIPHNPLD